MTDASTIPGGFRDYVRRDLPDGGLLEFEFAPAGYLTKADTVRRSDWRAYQYTPPGGKRVRMTSVTTLLAAIIPKGGLPIWAEARGIEGAVAAVRQGLINPADETQNVVDVVRANRLGADRARDEAADRGVSVHALLEAWSLAGTPPSPQDFHQEDRGYVQALSKWILKANPEPVEVEQIVVSPADGYAGRVDLKARVDGMLGTVDLKTAVKGATYASVHLQMGMYARADEACGGEPSEFKRAVILSPDGSFREQECMADDRAIDTALAYYAMLGPIDRACQNANRAERVTRDAVAA